MQSVHRSHASQARHRNFQRLTHAGPDMAELAVKTQEICKRMGCFIPSLHSLLPFMLELDFMLAPELFLLTIFRLSSRLCFPEENR